jgi:hypothetical protein
VSGVGGFGVGPAGPLSRERCGICHHEAHDPQWCDLPGCAPDGETLVIACDRIVLRVPLVRVSVPVPPPDRAALYAGLTVIGPARPGNHQHS